MAYPVNLSSLHFQYKTAFDVLKMYLPDKTDDELSSMVLEFKTKKEASKPPKEHKSPKAHKEPKAPKEVKEPKAPKEVKSKKSKV
jgi:hypothetical protein